MRKRRGRGHEICHNCWIQLMLGTESITKTVILHWKLQATKPITSQRERFSWQWICILAGSSCQFAENMSMPVWESKSRLEVNSPDYFSAQWQSTYYITFSSFCLLVAALRSISEFSVFSHLSQMTMASWFAFLLHSFIWISGFCSILLSWFHSFIIEFPVPSVAFSLKFWSGCWFFFWEFWGKWLQARLYSQSKSLATSL